MKVQQHVPAHDADLPPDRAIRFRVGVNVGDVIPDGTDVHGDVVNVAARTPGRVSTGRHLHLACGAGASARPA